MSLTARRAKDIVNKITYKPEWIFAITLINADEVELFVESPVYANKHDDKGTVQLNRSAVLELSALTEDNLKRRVEYEIGVLERHEMREWLKYEGECISVPHPEAS